MQHHLVVKEWVNCGILSDPSTARLAVVAERAEKGGEKLVNYSMRQVIILIVIWWIGYIIARVIVQAISKKSSANRV